MRWANDHRKWLFAAPAMVFVAALIVFPLAWTGYLSLTDAEGSVRAESEFVGFQNYLDVLSDTDRFWPAVGRTATFTVVALLFEVVLGMAIALLLWRPFKGQKWVRVAILMPLVATPVAVGMMWRLIFDPNIGMANQLLGWVGIAPQPWLGRPAHGPAHHDLHRRVAVDADGGADPARRAHLAVRGAAGGGARSTAPAPGSGSGTSPCRC